MKLKKRDLIFIIILLFIALISLLFLKTSSKNGSRAIVSVNKEVILSIPLDKDTNIVVPETKGENVVRIKDGAASMSEADCPDQICVKHKPISKSGETIVCLPHKVVIEIVSEEDSDFDVTT